MSGVFSQDMDELGRRGRGNHANGDHDYQLAERDLVANATRREHRAGRAAFHATEKMRLADELLQKMHNSNGDVRHGIGRASFEAIDTFVAGDVGGASRVRDSVAEE